jgi:2,5-didehydrogluconate reductase
MQTITLSTGAKMPVIGLGVFQMDDATIRDVVPAAVDAGYRLIDTASRYYNEKALGQTLDELDVPREELFITTKLWFKDYGQGKTKDALKVSLENLGLEYLDLYLMHQPFSDYYAAWRDMEEAMSEGLVRAIGVSNFYPDRYLDFVTHAGIIPAVNQRETHPYNQQIEMQELMAEYGTVLQAWGPLGQGNTAVREDPVLVGIAEAHGVSVAQVIIRWLIQRGVALVAKSTHAERLRANLDVFGFALSEEEMNAIAGVDKKTPNAGFTHQDPRMLQALLRLE